MALLVAGLAVVGAIIWGGLGLGGQQPTASVPQSQSQGQSPGSGDATAEPAVKIGMAAPNFTLPDTFNKTHSLSDYKGKVTVLEFFAPWCPHCQKDAPIINEVYSKYKDKGVEVLAVSATPYGKDREAPITMDDIIWFRDTYKVEHPMLLDKELKSTADYGIESYPTIYLVDKNGVITSEVELPFTAESLSADLDKLLK